MRCHSDAQQHLLLLLQRLRQLTVGNERNDLTTRGRERPLVHEERREEEDNKISTERGSEKKTEAS